VKHVLRYTTADPLDLAQVQQHYAAHRARWDDFHRNGTLLLIGPFADPREGAMAVFTTREAAEAFAAEDPFVLHGLVSACSITAWDEVLLDPV
jgi:uncharacterized protein YciI